MKPLEYFGVQLILTVLVASTVIVLAALYVHSQKVEPEKPCRYEISQLEVPCPG